MTIPRNITNAAFGAVLKGVVRENDKTQQGVADVLGQNVRTVQRIFKGERDVTVTQFLNIAEYLGESPQMILERVLAKIAQMSALPTNVTVLKKPADMTDDELDAINKKAAVNDPELEQDEADLP